MKVCPCGSGNSFEECCGPIIHGAPAATAQALMRSRYSAFTLGAFDHLESSLAPEGRTQFSRTAAEAMFKGVEWLGLEVRRVTDGGSEDQAGTVEFVARFREDGREQVHHELASFRRDSGDWVYVDGKLLPRQVTKVGRNDPCPCGSGKKFKKCCGAAA
jgi:SEC-C motif-containing protein